MTYRWKSIELGNPRKEKSCFYLQRMNVARDATTESQRVTESDVKMTSNKVSHDDEHFDFNKLEKEVQNAVINDEKYWRENDAKIRAVEQRVPTYEDFREMVLAAHIKPLEKDDKISSIGAFTQVWNQAAHKDSKNSPHERKEQTNTQDDNQHIGMKLPKSGQDFAQHWRRHCKTAEEKKTFLLAVGARQVEALFKTEISGGLLGEFLECLQCVTEEEAVASVELLESFTKSQRFSLSLAFLSKKEKDACKTLFEKLKDLSSVKECDSLMETLENLEGIYGVKDK